jgi:hypothetical protein
MKRIVVSWAVLGAAALLVAFAPLLCSAPAPTERLFRVKAGDFASPVHVLSARAGQLSIHFSIRGGTLNE